MPAAGEPEVLAHGAVDLPARLVRAGDDQRSRSLVLGQVRVVRGDRGPARMVVADLANVGEPRER